jgi:hypothetical protein
MAKRCHKCEQPVQDSDAVCWHCGAGLVEFSLPPAKSASTTAVANKPLEDEETPMSLTAVAFYAGVTAVCLMLLVLLISTIKQQPLYPWRPDISRQPGWTAVTDAQQKFTLNLPSDWAVSEVNALDFQQIAAFPQQLLALSAAAINQTAVPRLAANANDELFLLLYPVQQLSDNFLPDLQTTSTIQAIEVKQNEQGQQIISFTETLTLSKRDWLCKTHVMSNQEQNYAFFICQAADAAAPIADDLNTLLDSFQTLLP